MEIDQEDICLPDRKTNFKLDYSIDSNYSK